MGPALSDHYAIRCKVLLPKPPLEKTEIICRSLNHIDLSSFHKDIKNLNLIDNNIASLNDLVERYNMKLGSLLDDHAPSKSKIVTLRPKSPWFTLEIQEWKVKRRRLERRWRKTRLTLDREIYTQQYVIVHRFILASKESYYTLRSYRRT